MTTKILFSVFDRVASAWLDPFYGPNEGFGARIFSNCCRDPEHPFGRNPEDYALFVVGNFSQTSGTVEGHEPHRLLTGTDAAAKAV